MEFACEYQTTQKTSTSQIQSARRSEYLLAEGKIVHMQLMAHYLFEKTRKYVFPLRNTAVVTERANLRARNNVFFSGGVWISESSESARPSCTQYR